MSVLSPEIRLLYRCADPAATGDELLALVKAVRNWPRVLALAGTEGAIARLWRGLGNHAEHLPPGLADYLRSRSMLDDFRMSQLSAHLATTLAEFRTRHVPLLLLKGAALGALVDPTFRTRPMTDIDALIQPDDAEHAHAALVAAGWHQSTDRRHHELLEGMHHEAPFYHERLPGLRFELHTKVLPPDQPFSWDESALWATATDAPPPLHGAKVPSLTNQLLHTAIHFAWQHQLAFGTWRTARSVALTARQPSFDWDAFTAQACAARAATCAYWTVRLTATLADVAIPPQVMAACAPPTPAPIRNAIERFIVSGIAPGESPVSPSTTLSHMLWRAAIRPRWSRHHESERMHSASEWDEWRGIHQPETLGKKLTRQATSYRNWWRFFTRTLLGV